MIFLRIEEYSFINAIKFLFETYLLGYLKYNINKIKTLSMSFVILKFDINQTGGLYYANEFLESGAE